MPINKVMYPVRSRYPGLVPLIVKLDGAGASAPTQAEGRGTWGIVRNGVGDYTLTVDGQGEIDIRSIQPTIEASALHIAFVNNVAKATGTFDLKYLDAAGAANDIAVGESVWLVVWVKNSKGK